MADPMKIRAVVRNGVADVRVLMAHEMETGQRKDSSGKLVPAWYISEVSATLNGKEVLKAHWGPAISKNPYLQFKVKGATATIKGSCKGQESSCSKSNPARLRKGSGYTTVTLPAGSSALKSTFVEVYTAGMSVKDIKEFVSGLEPVQ